VDAGALSSLRQRLRGDVSGAPDALGAVSRDASHVLGRAELRVRPVDVEDVIALVRWAREHRIPLTARGGGTSLDGESVPVSGGAVVDFSGWTDIAEVDPVGRTVRVGPGVVVADLHRRLASLGLFFPPNPGSWRSCTVGGNVATNASGPRSFRYGPTGRWVHSLDVVLGTGERVTLGPATSKRSVGPELRELIVGSEGTLGLVTSVTLALAHGPTRRVGVVVPVPEGEPLSPVVMALARRGSLRLSAIEFVDSRVAEALRRTSDLRLPGNSSLILLEVESDGPESEAAAFAELDVTLRFFGISEPTTIVPEADALWTVRGEAGAALDASFGPRVREDVAVPVDRIDPLMQAIRQIAARAGRELYVYAHLGQGHLHPNVVVDPSSPEGEAIRLEIWNAASALGGTVSGEHGVGSVKRERVPGERGDVAVRLLRGWKALCDPDGILNPGKLLPEPGRASPSPERSPPASGAGRTGEG
jgi:FAD/FMN-containing dehydrogenase